MNSERWERIQLLFEKALEQPPEARDAFIESACGGEIALRNEVVSLLAAHERDFGDELPTLWLEPLVARQRPRLRADEQVAERYIIQRLLGQGGMGEVYEAWDKDLSISVALKMLRLHLRSGQEDEALQQLKREGFLARSVSHPNICRVYDLGRHQDGEDTVWFLTMELLRGETLADRLRAQGKFSPETALPLAEQMAGGLGAAHRAGVIHRDFKAANVMLVNEGSRELAVITDFGIARSPTTAVGLEALGDGRVLVGTPAYMAPEQLRGALAGPTADIYSLGMVLYEMVTGRLPFGGESAITAGRQRFEAEVPSPRVFAPELDDRWEAVILRCLAKEPSQRFQRAEDMAHALAGHHVPVAEIQTTASSTCVAHTLPAELDAFVGREMEIEEITRHFDGDSRLLTLLGAGGMGKTRLAVHYGWQSLGDWPGGVWFCDLTEARDMNRVASVTAEALGVQLGSGDPIAQLGHAIAGRGRCLLILDNFEQLVPNALETVGLWMRKAETARFLVTSRERLGLGNVERVQRVEPLLPDQGTKLFGARARWLCPGLELTDGEAEAAREIVRLVDGMPLAIELAATRMRVMSAAQIATHLRKRFQLLTGGRNVRHETLAVAIDGSWELLEPWEKSAWAQCAVFEGGFTLEAAEAVVDLGACPGAPWVVDVIQSLVNKSLIRTWIPRSGMESRPSKLRFGMYVSLQEYARIKLREDKTIEVEGGGSGAERAAEERHGSWYTQFFAPRENVVSGDLENLLAACRRASERGDGNTAVRAFQASWLHIQLRGPFASAVELGRKVQSELAPKSPMRWQLLISLAQAEWSSGDMETARARFDEALSCHRESRAGPLDPIVLDNLGSLHRSLGEAEEAQKYFKMALAIAREVGDRFVEGITLGHLGILHREQGRVEEARACYEAALVIDREVGNTQSEGVLLSNLGNLDRLQGRLEEARTNHEAALAIHRQLGNRRSEGHVLGSLGNVYYDLGRLDSALAHYEAALAIHREVGDRRFEGVTRNFLGTAHLQCGQLQEAEEHCLAALAIAREAGNRRVEASVLGTLGSLRRAQGRLDEARTVFEEALTIAVEIRNRTFEGTILGSLGSLLHQSGSKEQARVALARGEDILRQTNARLDLAKVLCFRAELESSEGDVSSAAATMREVEALATEVKAGPDSELGQMVGKLRSGLDTR